MLERLITTETTAGWFGLWDPFYNDEILLQTILYRFFEVETIRQFENYTSAMNHLNNYLGKCCETVLRTAQEIQQETREYIEDWKLVEPSCLKEPSLPPNFIIDRSNRMNWLITNEVKEFIFKIECMSARESIFPIGVLAKDKKFNIVFSEIRRDFHLGSCKF